MQGCFHLRNWQNLVKLKNEKYGECEQNGFGIGVDDDYSRCGPNSTVDVELRRCNLL